jgi:hypothetical protein
MTTDVDLTNRALAEIGSRSQISSMTDGSTEALYANILFNPLRDFMLREGDYDFAMKEATVVAGGAVAFPWAFSYNYPNDCIRIRQAVPATTVTLNPLPVEWNVSGGGVIRTIVTNTPLIFIIYTYAPDIDFWDSIFTEAFVRLLGSALSFALQNRTDGSKEKLVEALQFAGIADLRDS